MNFNVQIIRHKWCHVIGSRVITCVQTMVVVGNRHTINVRVVGDKYWWSVKAILRRLVQHTVAKRIITHDSEFYMKKLND